ncbi:MFS transporter [Lusitaniella coriacea LEGE 07157]|uniref:MFS transporter n=1 Tax=Lusitaniella coriacea LEGE 07157 TaxID=945747 RepID=A0A8J7B7K9_9CYAN|nr:MFS transporter [Lusitaniella coriacea]MBE9115474.1 MFS transporter [Lusitaniella coriacea LEGE 07157]
MQDREELTQPQTETSPSNNSSPKKRFNFLQLWNMNVGFLGIQFGWGLQMANMSAIFEYLGADAHQIPILWIAAPLTGLIVQPIIGNLSDYTWGPLGRRRPYFLVGAIFSSIALVLMPTVGALWMAVALLWILDTCANISMTPFRAFVGDLLPKNQRTWGFALQSLMVGIGSVSASALPWILNHVFSVEPLQTASHQIPLTVELSFYIGAAVFLGTVVWTVITTQENPPKNLEVFEKMQERRGGLSNSLRETWIAIRQMPPTMQQLAWVQFFTWLGVFCFFLYFPPAVAWNIFGATDQHSELYSLGIEWAGICFAVYNGVCVGFSFLLPHLVRWTNRKIVHSVCLLCGGVGLISLIAIHNQYLLLAAMVGVGIAWSSILAMPYAMLIGAIPPQRMGIYMGIFNFFIVLPEILASLGFGWVMKHLLDNNRLEAVVLGGACFAIAAILTLFVTTPTAREATDRETEQEKAVEAETPAQVI